MTEVISTEKRVYYRSYLTTDKVKSAFEEGKTYPIGTMWCESSSLEEVRERSKGYKVRYEKCEVLITETSDGWVPFTPVSKKKIRDLA